MSKPLLGEKIAVLVANGFCEQALTQMQRALQPLGAVIRVISMDQGLVNSWNGEGWGLTFAPDGVLSEALAADFSALIVPGGQRSNEKLKLTAHTRRFINGFLDTAKPVVMAGDAIDLLVHIEKIAGRSVCAPESMKEAVEKAGAILCEDGYAIHDNLMTGDVVQNMAQVAEFLSAHYSLDEAA